MVVIEYEILRGIQFSIKALSANQYTLLPLKFSLLWNLVCQDFWRLQVIDCYDLQKHVCKHYVKPKVISVIFWI